MELPLKDEGAYLVVCRGENLYTSGLVLVSPLGLEIQEDESGRVRVTVKDTTTDSYLHKVHVKVIGTANSEFVSGDTDLRGVFIADAINGVVTVIARTAESRYAFYRGKYWVGPPPAQPQQQVEQMPASGGRGARGRPPEAAPAEALLKQLKDSNSSFNNDQRENYQRLLKNRQQGVDSKSAY